MYPSLGGGWREMLVVVAVILGVVMASMASAALRLAGRTPPPFFALVVVSAILAIGASMVGARFGAQENQAGEDWASNACGDGVAQEVLALGRAAGRVISLNGSLSRGGTDGRCHVDVAVEQDTAGALDAVGRAAAQLGWDDAGVDAGGNPSWRSESGVVVTGEVDAPREEDVAETGVLLRGTRE
jgi:hypothetical protein